MPMNFLAAAAQSMPVIQHIDGEDVGSVATIILIQIMAQVFGDDLFKTIVGFACLCLVLLSGLRLSIKAYKEYQEARTVKLKNDQIEHDLEE